MDDVLLAESMAVKRYAVAIIKVRLLREKHCSKIAIVLLSDGGLGGGSYVDC